MLRINTNLLPAYCERQASLHFNDFLMLYMH